jgi:TPP-dependent pyruvate/acetoin dehydrogenase alpha subunit
VLPECLAAKKRNRPTLALRNQDTISLALIMPKTQRRTPPKPQSKTRNPAVKRSPAAAPSEREIVEPLLYYMKLQREMEDRIERKLYRQGKVLGGVYTGRGQEAIGVAPALLAEPGDVLCPCHRDMGAFLVRGMKPSLILAQYLGRQDGPTHGRDGNMHMGDLKLGLVSFVSALAAIVPVAGGIALAMRYRGLPNVVINWHGDGATSRGDWHEGLNLAAVQKLPVVYVINNNEYAYSTPLELQMPVKNVADRASAYGMPSAIVDGNDALAVRAAARKAMAHARAGKGPYMIECKSFRMTGHSAHDAAEYVPKELFAAWKKRDPILRLEAYARKKRLFTAEELQAMSERVIAEVDEAVAWADSRPYPDPATLLDGVFEAR